MNMNRSSLVPTRWHVLTVLLLVTGVGIYMHLEARGKKVEREMVGLTGVQHLGSDYNIAEFYVDEAAGGNVGRGGGGGRDMCCVMLPKRWWPGMTVEVRWSVNDWRPENVRQIPEGLYRARVSVEKYLEVDQVYVHFFPGGRVRVRVGPQGPSTFGYAISRQDPRASDGATVATRVEELFTKEELAEMDRKTEEHRRKYGDWR